MSTRPYTPFSGKIGQNYFNKNIKTYIQNPINQLNLAWSIISIAFIGALFIGLFLIMLLGVFLLLNPEGDKSVLVYMGYIGIALIIFGIMGTYFNFNSVVATIDLDVEKNRQSLFVADDFDSALDNVALATDDNLASVIEDRRRSHASRESGVDENGEDAALGLDGIVRGDAGGRRPFPGRGGRGGVQFGDYEDPNFGQDFDPRGQGFNPRGQGNNPRRQGLNPGQVVLPDGRIVQGPILQVQGPNGQIQGQVQGRNENLVRGIQARPVRPDEGGIELAEVRRGNNVAPVPFKRPSPPVANNTRSDVLPKDVQRFLGSISEKLLTGQEITFPEIQAVKELQKEYTGLALTQIKGVLQYIT